MRGGRLIVEKVGCGGQTVNITCLAPTLSFTYSRLTPSVHSDNDVVESAWRVDAGFAWHAVSIAEHDRVGKL